MPRTGRAGSAWRTDLGIGTPQSAAIPWRLSGGALRVLLVTSKTTGRWVVPKGMIEPGLTPLASAAKEAYEEAGVVGRAVPDCLGVYRYMKSGRGHRLLCTVQVFPLRVTTVLADWPERRYRRRAWMSLDQARSRVREPELRRILDVFGRRLEGRRRSRARGA